MIKKIFFVTFLTGFSQIISLISVSFLKSLDQSLVYDIGNYESLIVIFTAVIALGLQLVTVRDIALSERWQHILIKSQKDRFSLSLVILLGVIGFDLIVAKLTYETLLFYVVIPLIALNADYSFYGKGEPERGSFLSFLRVGLLSLFIILSVIFENPYIKTTYIITVLITYFLVGILASYFNKQPYFLLPSTNFYQSYIGSLNVGLASFALVFFGLGIISFAGYFYTETAVANAYLLLKIYVFYVGIKRLLVQILFKELKDNKLVVLVDKLGIIIAVTVIFVLLYYPEFSIKYFTKDYVKSSHTLLYLLPAIFFTSLSYAGSLDLLLKNKDRIYSVGFILGACVVLILVFGLSFIDSAKESFIYLAISAGELIVILIHGWGIDKLKFFKIRLPYALFSGVIIFALNYGLLQLNNKIISLILFLLIIGGSLLFIFIKSMKSNPMRI